MNTSSRTKTFLCGTVGFFLAVALPVLVAGCKTCCYDGHQHYHPEVSVPCEHRQAFSLFATGVQIYGWTGTNWVLRGPEATLVDKSKKPAAKHYKGPTWEGIDGSKVTAKTATNTPAYISNSIPHLLLKVDFSTDSGMFAGITYIQRVNTVGGKAPSSPGNTVGQEARVAYSAEYVFYRKKK